MTAISARIDDLEQLVGKKLPRDYEGLNELLYSVKCEVSHPVTGREKPPELIADDLELQIENVDTNRPDTWSTEGIARALRGTLGIETGVKNYTLTKKPAVEISVDSKLKDVRPFIACVVARHPRLNDTIIRGLIHLQDKLDQSYGRKRRRSSIGFYDFDLITPPLKYGLAAPDEIRFVPLEGTEQLSLREILERHPKGIEYGDIVRHHERMPILMDDLGKVLSFPPIINSNDLGRVTPETKNILIEITGTLEQTVMDVLTILTTALADRDAEICPAVIHYNYEKERTTRTPDLRERRMKLSLDHTERLIGLKLTRTQVVSLLRRARYDVAKSGGKQLNVIVPCYRLDILHPVDIMEDIAMVYGLNRIVPKWPSSATIGGLSAIEEFSDTVRELVIGLGFQEILTYVMTNHEKLFTKMNRPLAPVVEVSNPKVMTMVCLRSWLLPSLMDFLSSNTHVEYPQRVFEVGDCTTPDPGLPAGVRDQRKLACLSIHSRANFTEMKSYLEPLMSNLGFEFSIERTSDPSFLDGRVGSILIGDQGVGLIGEVSPQVIENWKLEDPTSAMELDLDRLLKMRQS